MVKLRGISVSMVSQHGVRRIPEYEYPILDHPLQIDGSTFHSASIAMCYVPCYPGSQVWFDYSVQNPHPPEARYFFKLLRNGEVFTTWDCTARYNYQGRTMYALKYLGDHPQTGEPVIQRQAFCFSTNPSSDVGPFDDCIEIRVHRVEHRVRRRPKYADVGPHKAVVGKNIYHDGFGLVNGGVLSPKDPKHYYKYQLLDPVDKPYATIRFYYRPPKFLKNIGPIVPIASDVRESSISSSASTSSSKLVNLVTRPASKAESSRPPPQSDNCRATGSSRPGNGVVDSVGDWLHHHRLQKYTAALGQLSFDVLVTCSDEDLIRLGVAAQGARNKLLREFSAYEEHHSRNVTKGVHQYATETSPIASSSPNAVALKYSPTNSMKPSPSEYAREVLGSHGTEASPTILMEGNADESLTIPGPPNIPVSATPHRTVFLVQNSPPPTPNKTTTSSAPADKVTFTAEEAQSPCLPMQATSKKNPKSLKVEINGSEFDLQKQDQEAKKSKRPQSPFTHSGDMLRRLLHSPIPPSAPAHITEFGPTIEDEIRETLSSSSSSPTGVGSAYKGESPRIGLVRTTRAERGGSGLLGRLLKRSVA